MDTIPTPTGFKSSPICSAADDRSFKEKISIQDHLPKSFPHKSILKNTCKVSKSACYSLLRCFDRIIQKVGKEISISARNAREWPPHKYFAQPLYKALSSRVGRPIATASVFMACAIVFHQLPSSFVGYVLGKQIISTSDVALNMLWGMMGVSVAFYKYRNSNVRT